MERDVIEERTCETSSSNLVTNSSINQTSAELDNVVQNKVSNKCSHFSIRAYAAEIRRKDWKISWPFSSVGDNEEQKKQVDMLPPLHIPEFKWWGCQNCLWSSDVAPDFRVVSISSEEKICEGRKASVNTSMDMIEYECCAMVDNNMKEKVADVISNAREDVLTTRNLKNGETRKEDQLRQEPALSEVEDVQCLNVERLGDDTETIGLFSEGGAPGELGMPNCGTSKVDEIGLEAQNPKYPGNSSTDQMTNIVSRVCEVAKMNLQKRELMTYHETLGLVNVENEVIDSLTSHSSKYFSSKCNENVENEELDNLHIQHHGYEHGDSGQTLICGKPRKVRLLTDIMRKESRGTSTIIPSSDETKNSDKIVNSDFAQTKETDEYDGLNSETLYKCLPPVLEITRKDAVSKGKKRKMLHQEKNCVKDEIAHSESVNDAFAGVDLHSGRKTQSNESGPDGLVVYSKKKNSMHHCEDGKVCSSPSQGSLSRGLQLMNRVVESKETCSGPPQFKMAHKASIGRGFHGLHKCKIAAQEPVNKSSFCMNKSNIPENVQETLITLQKGMQREDLSRQSDTGVGTAIASFGSAVDALSGISVHHDACSKKSTSRVHFMGEMQTNKTLGKGENSNQHFSFTSTGIELVPAKTSQETMLERAPHTSLNHCMDTAKKGSKLTFLKKKAEVPQVKGGIASRIPHQEDMQKEDLVASGDERVKPAVTTGISVVFAPSFPEKVGRCGLKSIKCSLRKASMSMKLNDTAQVQESGSPLGSKDCPIIDNCRNNMDDDIPMEIVELLAKNRHERCLIETENANRNKYSMPETTKNVKTAGTMELTGVLEDEMTEYLQENTKIQKCQSSNEGGCIFATHTSVEVRPVGKNSFEHNSHFEEACRSIRSNINHFEESHDTEGLFQFPVSQGNHSHESEVADAGSIKSIGFQRWRRNGDKLGHSCRTPCLLGLNASPKGSCQRQCREAPHACLMNIANGPSEIVYSHRFATLSQKQNRDFDFMMSKQINAEQPCACMQKKIGSCSKLVGSSDLYTDKTVSAVQLLRLMDSGISSSTSPNAGENREFTKQPFIPRNKFCKELSPLNDGISKIRETSKQTFPAYLGKNHSIEKSGKHFPSEEVSYISKSPEKGNKESSCLPMPASGSKFDGAAASGNGRLGRNHQSFPPNGLNKGFHLASETMELPVKSRLTEASIVDAEVSNKVETFWPVEGKIRDEGICTVNRNPADFYTWESEDEYTREGADIKCRKKIGKRGRPRLKMRKLEALKEPAQKLNS